jgi:hypothetical protein
MYRAFSVSAARSASRATRVARSCAAHRPACSRSRGSMRTDRLARSSCACPPPRTVPPCSSSNTPSSLRRPPLSSSTVPKPICTASGPAGRGRWEGPLDHLGKYLRGELPVRRSRRRRPGVAVDLLMFALVYVAIALLGIRHQWLTFRATEHDIVNDSLGSNAASSDVLRET